MSSNIAVQIKFRPAHEWFFEFPSHGSPTIKNKLYKRGEIVFYSQSNILPTACTYNTHELISFESFIKLDMSEILSFFSSFDPMNFNLKVLI
jgi:hypothetical protein